MNPINILIAEDHGMMRAALKALLVERPNFKVVGEASNGAEAIDLTRNLKPDLVLMDIRMPVLDGIQATKQIMTEAPSTRIVMLTASEEEKDLYLAIQGGAHGYILKNTGAEEFYRFIEGAMAGGTPISGTMATKMVNKLSERLPAQIQKSASMEKLSKRELQVLRCLGSGPTNQQIATKLAISESTVKKHIHRILIKLHLDNRSQAAVVAGGITTNTELSTPIHQNGSSSKNQ